MDFPFDEPENVAVFTCFHIMEKNKDICHVFHDNDDGAWQFLCDKKHSMSDARIVSLKSIFEKDPSVGALADMPPGYGATRKNKSSPWMGFKKHP